MKLKRQGEARAFKHNYIGTEHLLLGLLLVDEGLAAQVLGSLDVTIDAARARVATIGEGDEIVGNQIPFTPLAKKVLGWAAEFRDITRIVETAWAWHQRPVKS